MPLQLREADQRLPPTVIPGRNGGMALLRLARVRCTKGVLEQAGRRRDGNHGSSINPVCAIDGAVSMG